VFSVALWDDRTEGEEPLVLSLVLSLPFDSPIIVHKIIDETMGDQKREASGQRQQNKEKSPCGSSRVGSMLTLPYANRRPNS
jgi:hypothetical protein